MTLLTAWPIEDAVSFTCSTTRLITLAGADAAGRGGAFFGALFFAAALRGAAFFAAAFRAGARRAAARFFALFFAPPFLAADFLPLFDDFLAERDDFFEDFFEDFLDLPLDFLEEDFLEAAIRCSPFQNVSGRHAVAVALHDVQFRSTCRECHASDAFRHGPSRSPSRSSSPWSSSPSTSSF